MHNLIPPKARDISLSLSRVFHFCLCSPKLQDLSRFKQIKCIGTQFEDVHVWWLVGLFWQPKTIVCTRHELPEKNTLLDQSIVLCATTVRCGEGGVAILLRCTNGCHSISDPIVLDVCECCEQILLAFRFSQTQNCKKRTHHFGTWPIA